METRAQNWFEATQQGLAIVKPVYEKQGISAFHYYYVNPAFTRQFNLPDQPLTDRVATTLQTYLDDPEIFHDMVAVMETGQDRRFVRNYSRAQQDIYYYISLTSLDDCLVINVQDISAQKRAEHQLERRLAMESTISSISKQLIVLSPEQSDTYWIEALGLISGHIGAERASIILYSEDHLQCYCSHEWCAPGIESHKNTNQRMAVDKEGWVYKQLIGEQLICLDIDQLPEEAIEEKTALLSMSIHSMIAIPLVEANKTRGFVGFYAGTVRQSWDQHDISLLKTFATLISNVFQRHRYMAAIDRAYQRLEGLYTIEQALLNYKLNNQSPFSIALGYVHRMVPCSRISVFKIDETTGLAHLTCRLIDGVVEENINTVAAVGFFLEHTRVTRGMLYLADRQSIESSIPAELNVEYDALQSLLIIPLYKDQTCIGAFTLAADTPHFFSEEYQQIVQELASSLAIVLYQLHIDDKLRHHTEQLEQLVEERTKEVNAIFEEAIDLHFTMNPSGQLVSVNRAFEECLGFAGHKLSGKAFWECVHLTEQAFVHDSLLRISSDQPLRNQTNQFIRKDGTYCTLEWSAIRIDHLICASARDISVRQQTERQLRNLTQRLQLATQVAHQGIWEVDLVGRQMIWDDRMYEIHGLEPGDDPPGFQHYMTFVHPDDLLSFRECFRMDTTENSIQNITRIIRPDKSIRWIRSVSQLIRNTDGLVVRMVGVVWDITEQKQVEQALRESAQRFREIAENVDEAFWVHSAHPFRMEYCNPACERILSNDWAHFRERPLSVLRAVADQDLPAVLTFIRQYKVGQEGQLYFRLQAAHDCVRWIQVRTFIIRDADGTLLRHIGIANDVTSQKEQEHVLRQSLEQQQKLNQLKSQFVATASHEFRTPLATIQSSVELIKLYLDRPVPDVKSSIAKHVAIVEKEIDLFNNLLADLLTIGTIDSGKVSFQPRWDDIVSLCEDIIATHFSHRSDLRRVKLTAPSSNYPVYLDPTLISHVLVNLLSNAFKFSDEDPHLRLCFSTDQLIIQVIDNGIGIPATDLSLLFQAFYRGQNTAGIPGTGLGLVISRQFTEIHGGQLTIDSQENAGTTCTIKLPLRVD